MRTFFAAVVTAALLGATAGSVPAGATDAGRPGPCGRDLLFCESFDRQPLGGPVTTAWGVDTRNGALTVERARHGRVLHVHTVDNGRAFLRVDDLAGRWPP
ncbi:hypothetical protein [Actinoplanes philippinensis]|uniref:hypothetical protein n=1 Tax=Actinoplanes philippinensis TaxID=35752 RepID=UPI0033D0F2D8